MNDRIIGAIRTGVPVLWGLALTWLIGQWPVVADALDWLTEQFGADVRTVIGLILTAAVVALYYWLIRTIAARFPKARPWIERFGLGSSKTPSYSGERVVNVTLRADVADYVAGLEAARRATESDDDPKHAA